MKKAFKVVLAGILVVAGLGLAACSSSGEALKIDEAVPKFSLPDLNGNTVSLKQYTGKTVILHFWQSAFDPCAKEMPYFQELQDEWSQSGDTVFLAIDVGEQTDTVKAFMQENNYTFNVLLDSKDEVAGKYNVLYVPTTFILDGEGNLKLKVEGSFKDKSAIEKQMAAYLP